MDDVLMAGLRALADENRKAPTMYEMREALRLARQFRDGGMEAEEAARSAGGTIVFRLYAVEVPPWQG